MIIVLHVIDINCFWNTSTGTDDPVFTALKFQCYNINILKFQQHTFQQNLQISKISTPFHCIIKLVFLHQMPTPINDFWRDPFQDWHLQMEEGKLQISVDQDSDDEQESQESN